MGECESERMLRDFQRVKAVERIRRKERDWVRRGRGRSWERREGILGFFLAGVGGCGFERMKEGDVCDVAWWWLW